MLFHSSHKDLNGFLLKAKKLMLASTPANDTLARESIHFLSDVVALRNIHFKLYVVFLLIRSNKSVREMLMQKERPEVIKPFLVYLDHELQTFLTGFRPPTTVESVEAVRLGEAPAYVRDDPEQFQYHCVEFLVFRIGRYYRIL